MPSNTYGRQVVLALVNKSGGSVAAGDVVIVDSSNDGAFTTTTTAGVTVGVGVAQETIASNATGRVLVSGYAALVNVNASVTRGQYGKTHTVAKQATGTSSRAAGTFCQWLTGGTTPTALVFPTDLGGASLSNPMTTKGDIILGDTGGTPTRLAAGTSGQVLVAAGAGAFPAWGAGGGYAYSAEQDLSGGAAASLDFTSIPGTGRHLVLEMMVRSTKSAAFDDLRITVNGDSSSIYDRAAVSAYSSTVIATVGIAQAFWYGGNPAAATAAANLFSYGRLVIPYYANTHHQKIARLSLDTVTANASGSQTVEEYALFYRATTAISRITVVMAGGNLAQYSIGSLYIVT